MSKAIRIDYFTDPYCAWSWALQPTLDELERLEGDAVTWCVRHRPLIRDLATSGKTAEEVAKAWEHIAGVTGAEIDASAWRVRPPASTLPAIRGALAARRQDNRSERAFLKALRPMLLNGGRVADDATLCDAARVAGLDLGRFGQDLADPGLDATIAEEERLAKVEGICATPALVLRAEGQQDRIVVEGPRDLLLLRRAIQVLRAEAAIEAGSHARLVSTFVPEPDVSSPAPGTTGA